MPGESGREPTDRAWDPKRFAAKTEAPENTERPRLLARYIHGLLSLALDAQKGEDAEAKQLDLCRRALTQLITKLRFSPATT